MRISEKQKLLNWDRFVKDTMRATPIDRSEAVEKKITRKKNLEDDWEAFMLYYFPQFCKAKFARWQKRYVKRVLQGGKKYIVRKIHRDGAKTTFTQMLVIYLMCRGKFKNLLWVSKSNDGAMEMLRAVRLQLEANQRLINDYGEFKTLGAWTDDKFVTRQGVSFRAIGKGQSPRGAKEEENRPDVIICDDIDDDEEVLNKTRLDKSWDWMTGALFGCFSVDGDILFLVLNNKIAKDCLVERASEVADDSETVNLLDENGNVTWPERFSLEDCQYMIKKMGTRLSQREYFNNPITEGKNFKSEWIQHKPMKSLKDYSVLLSYLDPSFKSGKHADHKALILLGLCKGEIHVIKAWCAKASVAEMIEWHYQLKSYLDSESAVADMYMEEVFLQSLLYKDFYEASVAKGFAIPIRGDTRKKPDKDSRIGALAGYFERGQWYFNDLEKENHHMQQLVEQFILFEQGSNGVKKDGPDACEGGLYLAQQKIIHRVPPVIGKRQTNRGGY